MRKISLAISLVIILGIFFLFFYIYQINYPLDPNTEELFLFEIKKGESTRSIAQKLESERIIRSAFWFKNYLKNKKLAQKIIAGSFYLSPTMSISQIAKKITNLNIVSNETKITLIEGWNNKEIGEYLAKKGFCTIKKWQDLLSKYHNKKYDFLDKNALKFNLEGYLFPDTYRVYKNSNCYDILDKLLTNFSIKVDVNIKNDIKNQGKTLFEIITMASIIEKEVSDIEDMKIVSGIFWDRIKNGQALQSCATLAYILGENKQQYSYQDTKINSPYNTYQRKGLPPGPITNPGLNAIKAAIYPKYTDYNYFLSDPQTGNTIFSKTFIEHKKNKRKYLD